MSGTAHRPTTVRRACDPALADEAHGWKSAYVHIPFCRRRCPYCDFAIVDESSQRTDHGRYVDAVVAEIGMEEGIGPLDAVNLGGGTPSVVDPRDLGRIVDALVRRFGTTDDAEVSIEINPEDWSASLGGELAAAGFTRISIGGQSLDGGVLGELGRLHTEDRVVTAATEASGLFASTSVDLIFGHPAETDASWERTVRRVVDLPIDHISTYALTVEPGTELSRRVRAGAPAPDDDVQADRYATFEAIAGEAGFDRYEVSNHARPGHACRYNLATWAHGEYLGFGMAAHDHRWGLRSRNHRRLDRYLADVESGVRPRLGTERLDPTTAELDRLMLGLRLAAGTPITPIVTRFLDTAPARGMLDAGLIRIDGDRLAVADPMLVDTVARSAFTVRGHER